MGGGWGGDRNCCKLLWREHAEFFVCIDLAGAKMMYVCVCVLGGVCVCVCACVYVCVCVCVFCVAHIDEPCRARGLVMSYV